MLPKNYSMPIRHITLLQDATSAHSNKNLTFGIRNLVWKYLKKHLSLIEAVTQNPLRGRCDLKLTSSRDAPTIKKISFRNVSSNGNAFGEDAASVGPHQSQRTQSLIWFKTRCVHRIIL